MKVVGKTNDGRSVVAGLGELYFKEGIPLSVIFESAKQNSLIPSWYHLYQEMKKNGMKHERILHLLHEHVFESYGKEYRDHVINKLNEILPCQ